jgi:protoporphyrinogen/coproporphyrinogen III oxidase
MLSPTLSPRRVAVLGGGLTGLAAAHRLGELAVKSGVRLETTLFEGAERTGGVFGTREVEGFRVEFGADSFITNKPWCLDLCRRLGLDDRLISTDATYRRSLVLSRGKPVAVPDGFQLLTPVRLGPILKSPLFSPLGKLRMACELFIPARKDEADESLADFARRRFGTEALERIIQPMVGGIYTSDPERLSMRATMERFVALEREHGSVIRGMRAEQARQPDSSDPAASGARYGLFASLKTGMHELQDRLAERIVEQGTNVRTDTRVTRLTRGDGPAWSVTVSTKGAEETLPFDAVVLALPAWEAASLLGAVAPALAADLGGIEYASTAIVVSGHALSDITHPLDAFGLVIPAREKRRILAVSFTSRKFADRAPAGCVQLRTFVGGAMQPELLEQSDDEIVRMVRDEFAEILGVRGEPRFAVVARWRRAMPQYHVGHLDRVLRIERLASAIPGFALAGNAYRGVGLPDVIHSGEQAAERVAG